VRWIVGPDAVIHPGGIENGPQREEADHVRRLCRAHGFAFRRVELTQPSLSFMRSECLFQGGGGVDTRL